VRVYKGQRENTGTYLMPTERTETTASLTRFYGYYIYVYLYSSSLLFAMAVVIVSSLSTFLTSQQLSWFSKEYR
jgi:hypothetical protein